MTTKATTKPVFTDRDVAWMEFQLRRTALSEAVMAHRALNLDETIIETAQEFERYLRGEEAAS